jgi:hypothetical protein
MRRHVFVFVAVDRSMRATHFSVIRSLCVESVRLGFRLLQVPSVKYIKVISS